MSQAPQAPTFKYSTTRYIATLALFRSNAAPAHFCNTLLNLASSQHAMPRLLQLCCTLLRSASLHQQHQAASRACFLHRRCASLPISGCHVVLGVSRHVSHANKVHRTAQCPKPSSSRCLLCRHFAVVWLHFIQLRRLIVRLSLNAAVMNSFRALISSVLYLHFSHIACSKCPVPLLVPRRSLCNREVSLRHFANALLHVFCASFPAPFALIVLLNSIATASNSHLS